MFCPFPVYCHASAGLGVSRSTHRHTMNKICPTNKSDSAIVECLSGVRTPAKFSGSDRSTAVLTVGPSSKASVSSNSKQRPIEVSHTLHFVVGCRGN